jgi:hypothetical protein
MIPDLPEAVLIELGRLTWSAIHLEDVTDAICHSVKHRRREDQSTIGPKITAALEELREWQKGGCDVDEIRAWLERSNRALDKRNAILHSVPLVLFDEHHKKIGHALGEMPKRDRPYNVRPMEVSELREVRDELDAAREGWVEAAMFAFEHHPK